MKLVIFGTGRFYEKRKGALAKLFPEAEVCAFLDNDEKKQICDGKKVFRPEQVEEIQYDVILLMSLKEREMRDQLLSLGVNLSRIQTWEEFIEPCKSGGLHFYIGCNEKKIGKRVLVLSTELNYNGGTLAAAYATKALQELGYQVYLAAENGDIGFIYEMKEMGINVVIYPKLGNFGDEERLFISQFDVIFVNVFQMIEYAIRISAFRPVFWWIHEPRVLVEETCDKYPASLKNEYIERINVKSVSPIARKNFNRIFPNRIKEDIPYGLPDVGCCANVPPIEKVVFVVIGPVCELKGQDVFVDAIKKLEGLDDSIEFWLIGHAPLDDYVTNLKEKIREINQIKMIGNLSREEMQRVFAKVSIVVSPSREDCLPMVVTEGMMYGRPVIVSDKTGSASYIQNGCNGFIFQSEDARDLADKMGWIIAHRERLREMGEKARKTYEEHFTMEMFGKRLENELVEAERKYGDLTDVLCDR